MSVKLGFFVEDFKSAVQEQDGLKLATLLSLKDSHAQIISKLLRSGNINTEKLIESSVPAPWSAILYQHCLVLENLDDPLKMAQMQNALAQSFHSIFPQLTRWTLSALKVINQELIATSCTADRMLTQSDITGDNLEKAARTMNKAFSACATDRYSAIQDSRKWGVYFMVNLLFKAYFKLSSTNLCSTILRSVGSSDLPELDQYPKSEYLIYNSRQMTFKYYTGVLHFYNERFLEAAEDLLFSFNHLNILTEPASFHNRALILRYLIPAQILQGLLPSNFLLEQYKSLGVYAVLKDALQQGNLHLFDNTLEANQSLLIKWGTWLVVERCRLLVVRTLFKKIWEIMDKPSRLPLEILQRGLLVSKQMDFASLEEVSCLVVNLIDQSYMKGYISFEKQIVVLSNTKAFPNLKS